MVVVWLGFQTRTFSLTRSLFSSHWTSLSFSALCRGVAVAPAPPPSLPAGDTSLSLACVGGWRCEGARTTPLPLSCMFCPVKEKGARSPFSSFFFFFLFFFGLISHSTKIASLNLISWSNPNRYYDLLSTIRSRIRQGSILINLETNSKVEILFVFGETTK